MIPICILAIEDDSDREYMTWLFLQYQKLMYSTIQKITQDQWTADDVLQSSLEKLINKIALLRTLDRNRLVNYIITTCKNTAITEVQSKAKHTVLNFDDCHDRSPEDDFSMDARLIQKENIEALEHIWPQLDERSRYLLEARYILGKRAKDIAADLNVSPESVRMALTRARRSAYKLITQRNALKCQ